MKLMRKLFGGTKMTWPLVLIFAVVTGVMTGIIMLVPFLKKSAFVNIGVSFEFWFIFAIFVVANCKKPLEAGLKCFVFFLVSQPIVYLVQQPFTPEVDLLGTYYLYWFKWTLLTFPGGMIAHLITRGNLIGTLALSVAGAYLAFCGVEYVARCIQVGGISNLLYGLICIAAAVVYMFLFCPTKKLKAVYGGFILIALVSSALLSNTIKGSVSYPIDAPGEWVVSGFEDSGISAVITDGHTLDISYSKRNASCTVTCLNTDTGETVDVTVTIRDGNADIDFPG